MESTKNAWNANAGNNLHRVLILTLVLGNFLCAADASERDFEKERHMMVETQLRSPGRDIRNPRVLAAMKTVPRHEFVPSAFRAEAYADSPLPIGLGQTISQPFIVAFMTEQIDPQPGQKILEVGTGSGYQAAVLAEMGAEVFTVEIIPELAERAAETLKRLGYDKVHVRTGDGHEGWAEHAPFDAIVVTCAPDDIPLRLVEQLKDGGRMIIPVGPVGGVQELYLLEKTDGILHRKSVMPVRFVPMTGGN